MRHILVSVALAMVLPSFSAFEGFFYRQQWVPNEGTLQGVKLVMACRGGSVEEVKGQLYVMEGRLNESFPEYMNAITLQGVPTFTALTALCSGTDKIQERLEILQLLKSAGADVNQADGWTRTPLCEAAKENCLELAQALIENGANVNLISASAGLHPLGSAVYHASEEVAALLLQSGARLQPDLPSSPAGTMNFAVMGRAPSRMTRFLLEHCPELPVPLVSPTTLFLILNNRDLTPEKKSEKIGLLISLGVSLDPKLIVPPASWAYNPPLDEESKKAIENKSTPLSQLGFQFWG